MKKPDPFDAIKEATAHDIVTEGEKLVAEFAANHEHGEALGVHIFLRRVRALYHLADAQDGADPCPPKKNR